MQEICTLQWEPLKEYYKNSIKTMTLLNEIEANKKQLEREIKKQEWHKNSWSCKSISFFIAVSAWGIFDLVFISILCSILSSYDGLGVLVAIALIVSVILCIVTFYYI